MEKRKWLWKRKSFNSSPGGSDSSDSVSSTSERDSYKQDVLKGPPSSSDLSAEFASVSMRQENEVNETVRTLTEKLSAALVNISAKEDLVKQHSKVAEEAVAGWEKAEIELTIIKEKLESSGQQKILLEDRVSHLDGALKECVRQLRLAREEQEKNIFEALSEATKGWESTEREFQSRILELEKRSPPSADSDAADRLEALERENLSLKLELRQVSEELEIRTIERDLSTEAAETASKQTLESIKKVAKLESECRRLRNAATKTAPGRSAKSVAASSIYVDSLTDSQSDGTERLTFEEMDVCKVNSSELNGKMLCRSKNDGVIDNTSAVKIDLMDDFLEMERLAAMPDLEKQLSGENERMSKAEIDALVNCRVELEEKLVKLDKEKRELQDALLESQDVIESSRTQLIEAKTKMGNLQKDLDISKETIHSLEIQVAESQKTIEASQLRLREAEMRIQELQMELDMANEGKQSLESLLAKSKQSEGTVAVLRVQLTDAISRLGELQEELSQANEAKQILMSQLAELEARSAEMNANVLSLEEEVAKERALSEVNAIKCQSLEDELVKREELLLLQSNTSTRKIKMKQEHVDEAAGKLAECQKTIVSLRKQLESLATLEDFLIDTTSIPDFPTERAMVASANGELWKLHSNQTFIPKRDVKAPQYDNGKSPVSLVTSTSTTAPVPQATSTERNRNGFAKFFSRTKNGIQLEI
ncbi:hypothetical protein MLD38_001956 [Melastoma candidum]|uniref:Uncharacterized protein n=1 Tax=Melastoma candidum TaxID=119954 RepID=A0ACB9SNI5_9MYRT|nr:hypothetical protein MLD38_001956 [Melastoma candidum]